jgi:hypothetical protein
MSPAIDMPNDRLTIIAWSDNVTDRHGHDARGPYVERYWLGVLGPTATLVLRRVADELESSPNGFIMNIAETAQALGVSGRGSASPFVRAIGRLVQFEIARFAGPDTLAVRRNVPSLGRRHLVKLPTAIQQRHEYWLNQRVKNVS